MKYSVDFTLTEKCCQIILLLLFYRRNFGIREVDVQLQDIVSAIKLNIDK